MDTATGLTEIALMTRVLAVVTLVTAVVVIVGLVIDRSAARRERAGDR